MANPGNVVVLAKYEGGKGLTQVEAIRLANKRKLAIVPNTELNRRLVLTDTYKGEKDVYPAWSGTLAANAEPGKKLGKYIKYTDKGITYVFEVPDVFKNEKDCILAINHGFTKRGAPLIVPNEDGKRIVFTFAKGAKIELVENFPAKDGWYAADAKFGIPIGEQVDSSDPEARYLSRTGKYAGLLARGVGLGGYADRRDVGADRAPSFRFGVLAWENAVPLTEGPHP
jgi:hypothetical protein